MLSRDMLIWGQLFTKIDVLIICSVNSKLYQFRISQFLSWFRLYELFLQLSILYPVFDPGYFLYCCTWILQMFKIENKIIRIIKSVWALFWEKWTLFLSSFFRLLNAFLKLYYISSNLPYKSKHQPPSICQYQLRVSGMAKTRF